MINRVPIMVCLILGICGCIEGRKSTHELEHVVPAHWPTDLNDAAAKIEARMQPHSSQPDAIVAMDELIELIGWLPEIAADSSMSEANWEPLNSLANRVGKALRDSKQIQPVEKDLLALCTELRRLHSLEQPSSLDE